MLPLALHPAMTFTGTALDLDVVAHVEITDGGDTVLLAPAAASYDMFRGFAARGDAFAQAVHQPFALTSLSSKSTGEEEAPR